MEAGGELAEVLARGSSAYISFYELTILQLQEGEGPEGIYLVKAYTCKPADGGELRGQAVAVKPALAFEMAIVQAELEAGLIERMAKEEGEADAKS